MSQGKTKKEKIISPKKEIRNQISNHLKNGLINLEEKLGKKEFESRVKKAAKLLAAGIKIKPVKAVKTKSAKKEIAPPEEKPE
jgi:CRISPR/Cas system CMR-associated protein Cmr5 small subunit